VKDGRLIDALRDGWTRCGLANRQVLLAVSGGADSVALLRGVLTLREPPAVELHVAHMNHGLRGPDADADAAWVGDLCRSLGVPCHVGHEPVPESVVRETGSLEAAARQVRYAFLERTALACGCTHVAVAHTADDQAETVLHHILRGTGLAGLVGMPSLRPLSGGVLLARPMLEATRSQVVEYLDEIGQDHRHDETNCDTGFTRNRLRHELLPILEREFNPRVKAALVRLSRQAAEVTEHLDRQAAELLAAATIGRDGDKWRLSCDVLRQQPPLLVRACLALLWREADWPRQRMDFGHYDRLDRLIRERRGHSGADFPDAVTARRRRGVLTVRRGEREV
jgi:tRNA(Ile)-lysidine synthase